MSDTPRTDAEVIEASFPEALVVSAEFARQLERELNQTTKQLMDFVNWQMRSL